MSATAFELITLVEQRGGRFFFEGDRLEIEPVQAGLPLLESLRAHRVAILEALRGRQREQSAEFRNYWRAAFRKWLEARCVQGPRWFGNVNALHVNFCEWQAASNADPCNREIFAGLLEEIDSIVAELDGAEHANGLSLIEGSEQYVEQFRREHRGRAAA
jgi:hypothetical protein